MAGETNITVVGNLTADPEMRFTNTGVGVASFTIASTPRTYDRNTGEWVDGDALFLRCSAWRNIAENVVETLTKGMRVIAQGSLRQNSYTASDGTNRTTFEMQVDEIGPSLRYASAQVTRKTGNSGANNAFQPANQALSTPAASSAPAAKDAFTADDPWSDDDLTDPNDLPF